MAFSQNHSGVEAAFGRIRDISVRTVTLGMRRAPLALVLLAAMGLGCGGSSPGDGGDASTQDGGDARAEVAPGADECSLVRQDCPAGMMCIFSCGTGGVYTTCVADTGGTLTHGETCSQIGNSLLCAKGNFCAIFVNLDGGSRQSCNKYCTTSADCPDGLPCMTFYQDCGDLRPKTLGRCEFAP